MREIPPEWEEVMRIAEQIQNGEIVIKIQQKKLIMTEYTVKRKPEEAGDGFQIIPF